LQLKLGAIFIDQGEMNAGIAALEKAAKLDPRNPQVYVQMGRILQIQNNWDGAIKAFEKATNILPNSVEAQAGLADSYLAKSDFMMATIAYRRLTELAPQNAQAYYNLGLALKERARNSEAIAALEKARDLFRSQNQVEGFQKAEATLRQIRE